MNKKYNILIVEIKNYEDVDFFYEYNLDNSENSESNLNLNNLNEKGNLLYLLSLIKKDNYLFSKPNIEFSFGIQKEINENEINISFNYDKSFLGSPIMNMTDNELIGILSSFDKGITLKYILKEYFMIHNNAYLNGNDMNNFQHMNLMMNQIEFQTQQSQQNIIYQSQMIH